MAATGPTLIHFVYVILKMTVNFVYCTATLYIVQPKKRFYWENLDCKHFAKPST